MEKYDPDAKCPKCGSDLITTKYYGNYTEFAGLRRRCQRCGYDWQEEPLDVNKENGK